MILAPRVTASQLLSNSLFQYYSLHFGGINFPQKSNFWENFWIGCPPCIATIGGFRGARGQCPSLNISYLYVTVTINSMKISCDMMFNR